MNLVDRLAPVLETLSALLMVKDPSYSDGFLETLQLLLSILDSLNINELNEGDVEELINPSFLLLATVSEMGQHDDEWATVAALIWKMYVKLMRRFGRSVDDLIVERFLRILISSCDEGLTLIQESWGENSLIIQERLKLLTFFVQRLTATLVNCTPYFDRNVKLQISSLLLLFAFFGVMNHNENAIEVQYSKQVLNNSFQGLFKILTTNEQEQHSSQITELELENAFYVLKLNISELYSLIDVVSMVPEKEAGGNILLTSMCSFHHHTSSIHKGILCFLIKSLSLIATCDIKSNSAQLHQHRTDRLNLIERMIQCAVRVISQQLRLELNQITDKSYLRNLKLLASSIASLMVENSSSICIWDFLVLKGLTLHSGYALIGSAFNLEVSIYRHLANFVLNEFNCQDQLDIIRRALEHSSIVFNNWKDKSSAHILGAFLVSLIVFLPPSEKKVVVIELFNAGKQNEMLAVGVLPCLIRFDCEIFFKDDLLMATYVRRQLQILIATSGSSISASHDTGFSALVLAAFIGAVKTTVSPSKTILELTSFVQNKSIGSLIIRLLSALTRHMEHRLCLHNSNSISLSYLGRLATIVWAIVPLAQLLCLHKLPNMVSSILQENAWKLSLAIRAVVEWDHGENSSGSDSRCTFVFNSLQAFISLQRLIVAAEGVSYTSEHFQKSFENINFVWKELCARDFWHWHIVESVLSGIICLMESCSSSNKASLMKALDENLRNLVKSLRNHIPLLFDGTSPIMLSQQKVYSLSKFVITDVDNSPNISDNRLNLLVASYHSSKRRKLNNEEV